MHNNSEEEDSDKEAGLFLERNKEKDSQANHRATLENIDKFMRDREYRDLFDMQAAFGRIEYHMQVVVEDDGAIIDPDMDMNWKQETNEKAHHKYEYCRTIFNYIKESVPYFEKDVINCRYSPSV